MHTVNYSTTALLFYDRLLWAAFDTNFMIVSELIEKLQTLPQDKQVVLCDLQNDGDGYWTWKSKNVNTGKEITYGVREGMSHYAPNLYDYEAYNGFKLL